jgi:hypothetical protein
MFNNEPSDARICARRWRGHPVLRGDAGVEMAHQCFVATNLRASLRAVSPMVRLTIDLPADAA